MVAVVNAERLARLAPWPTAASESAEAVILAFGARAMAAACADDGDGEEWPGDPAVPWLTLALFAAAHALGMLHEAAPGAGEMCAADIVTAAADPGELADWLYDALGGAVFASIRAIAVTPRTPKPRTESERS